MPRRAMSSGERHGSIPIRFDLLPLDSNKEVARIGVLVKRRREASWFVDASCAVRSECLDFAMNDLNLHGVCAGLTVIECQKLRWVKEA